MSASPGAQYRLTLAQLLMGMMGIAPTRRRVQHVLPEDDQTALGLGSEDDPTVEVDGTALEGLLSTPQPNEREQ